MRRPPALFAVLALLAASAVAQTQTNLQPLPAVPPPPPDMAPFDAALEPQVTIKKRDGDTVEEFRAGGRLYMIKVTPAHGVPYYLVDDRGTGEMVRRESLDNGLRPPMWLLKEF